MVSGMGGVGHNLSCPPQGPGGVQLLEGGKVAADRLLCSTDDPLQPGLVPGGGSSEPDGDGGGEDGGGEDGWRRRGWTR